MKHVVFFSILFIFIMSKTIAQQDTFNVNNPRYNRFGQTVVSTDSSLILPPVSIFATERGDDMTINLLIEENINKKYYSAYFIERSTDGINFIRLNQEPYFFVGPDSEDTKDQDLGAQQNPEIADLRSAVYTDSVPTYDTYYYYRIIGTTNLGQLSEPSPVVKEKAKRPRIDFTFFLDTIVYDPVTDDVTIFFPDYADSIKNRLIGYMLYKSVFHDGPFAPVNNQLIPTASDSYIDIDPFLSGYYIAVSWDNEGYEYRTYSYLHQLPDSIPPPVPAIKQAKYIENERVRIDWDDVYAEDLKGYYLFFANGKNGEYNPVNSTAIKDTTLTKYFETGMEIDSIFFKVASIDSRGNISNSSIPYGIKRPGKFAAAKPMNHSVRPYTDGDRGVVVAFSFSPDKDIKYHKLERRTASNAKWMEILRVYPHEEQNYLQGPDQESYIDSTYIRNESLEYRLLVVDEDDFVSGSELVDVFPLNNQADGYINQLQLKKNIVNASYPPLPQFQSSIAATLPHQTIKSITLSWVYDLNPRLEGFVIYRGVTGGHLIEYRTIPKDDMMKEPAEGNKYRFIFEDVSLIGNKRYTYKVMALHLDGTTSHMSNAVSAKFD